MSFTHRLDPLGDDISRVEVYNFMGSDATVVDAARVSFLNDDLPEEVDPEDYLDLRGYVLACQEERQIRYDPEKDRKLISFLARNKHSSPFEHGKITFVVEIPIFLLRQWVRHRTWSYVSLNEVSRRYTSENIRFYIPDSLKVQGETNRQGSAGEMNEKTSGILTRQMRRHAEISLSLYERILSNGGSREEARMVLPQNLYTRIYGTVDLWNLAHLYHLRADKHAQWQLREYASSLSVLAGQLFPDTWEALTR